MKSLKQILSEKDGASPAYGSPEDRKHFAHHATMAIHHFQTAYDKERRKSDPRFVTFYLHRPEVLTYDNWNLKHHSQARRHEKEFLSRHGHLFKGHPDEKKSTKGLYRS